MIRSVPHARALVAGVLVAGLAVLTACSSSSGGSATAADASAPLATSVPSGTSLTIADQNQQLKTLFSASGVDKNLGFSVQWQELNGQPQVLQALRAGADVASASEAGAIFASAQGLPVKVIGVVKNSTSNPYVFSTSHADITSVAQLKGKKIAWVQGTSYSLYTIRALKSAGLTTKDVQLVNLTFDTIPNAVRTGLVDAGAIVEPTATSFLDKYKADGLHELTEAHDLTTGLVSTLYATQKSLSDSAKSAALAKFDAAFIKAQLWIDANPKAWEQAYYIGVVKVTPEAAAVVVAKRGTTSVPTLTSLVPTYQGFVEELSSADQLPNSIDAKMIIDTRFDAVEQSASRSS